MSDLDVDQVEYVPASHMGGAHGHTDLFVLHTAEFPELVGVAAERVAAFFHNTTEFASAQYTVDDDSAVCCVPESRVSYAAGTPGGNPIQANATGQHFEIAGYASQDDEEWDDPFSRATLVNLARICTQMIERRYPNIRPVYLDVAALQRGERDGFTSHQAIEYACYANPQRTDPGWSFPWDRFLGMVKHQPTAADLAAFFAMLEELERAKEEEAMKPTLYGSLENPEWGIYMLDAYGLRHVQSSRAVDELVNKGAVTNKRVNGQVQIPTLNSDGWTALVNGDAIVERLMALPVPGD